MVSRFTLEYWIEDGWYVGKLKQVPGVFSQGASLSDLEDNIEDAYQLLMEDEAQAPSRSDVRTKEIVIKS